MLSKSLMSDVSWYYVDTTLYEYVKISPVLKKLCKSFTNEGEKIIFFFECLTTTRSWNQTLLAICSKSHQHHFRISDLLLVENQKSIFQGFTTSTWWSMNFKKAKISAQRCQIFGLYWFEIPLLLLSSNKQVCMPFSYSQMSFLFFFSHWFCYEKGTC